MFLLKLRIFYKKIDKEDSQWEIFKGLGRSGDSVKVIPDLTDSITTDIEKDSPVLQYKIYFFSTGTFPIEIHRVPTLAPYSGRFALGLDDSDPVILTGTNNVNDQAWRTNILEQVEKITTSITVEEPGYHTLNLWKVDPGVIIDKIVIDTGGLEDSYFGPPESYNSLSEYINMPVEKLSTINLTELDIKKS